MKKRYETPVIELMLLNPNAIIVTSGEVDGFLGEFDSFSDFN